MRERTYSDGMMNKQARVFNFQCFCVIALPLSGTFLGHKIVMGFFGGQFLVQGFFGVLLEALRIFLGLDFWLHSISTPPGEVAKCFFVSWWNWNLKMLVFEGSGNRCTRRKSSKH